MDITQILPTGKYISEMQCVYTVEYCIYVTKNEVLIHTTVWINIEKIMLHEEWGMKDHIVHNSVYIKCLEQTNPLTEEDQLSFREQWMQKIP